MSNRIELKGKENQNGQEPKWSNFIDTVAVIQQSAAERVRVPADRLNRREICRAAFIPLPILIYPNPNFLSILANIGTIFPQIGETMIRRSASTPAQRTKHKTAVTTMIIS